MCKMILVRLLIGRKVLLLSPNWFLLRRVSHDKKQEDFKQTR